MVWQPLEHELWKQFKNLPEIYRSHFIIGFSGGADSVALVLCLAHLSQAMGTQVRVMYVHHGLEPDSQSLNQFRNQCRDWGNEFCQKLNLEFVVSELPTKILKNEEELRNHRYHQLTQLQKENEILVLGHHSDDLLETRLLRLIRGTSGDGLMAMNHWEPQRRIWRPLLNISKAEILNYLQNQQQNFLEDPSNQDQNYLRNWIRHSWLASLEAREPGAKKSLHRSLETIANQLKIASSPKDDFFSLIHSGASREVYLLRAEYLSLEKPVQFNIIAQMLKKVEVSSFTQGLLNEIKKRLDNPQTMHTFVLSDCQWSVDAKQIKLKALNCNSQL